MADRLFTPGRRERFFTPGERESAFGEVLAFIERQGARARANRAAEQSRRKLTADELEELEGLALSAVMAGPAR